jgi:hypothetical protein
MNEIILHLENHKTSIKSMGKNSEFVTVEETGTYSDHCGVKD